MLLVTVRKLYSFSVSDPVSPCRDDEIVKVGSLLRRELVARQITLPLFCPFFARFLAPPQSCPRQSIIYFSQVAEGIFFFSSRFTLSFLHADGHLLKLALSLWPRL